MTLRQNRSPHAMRDTTIEVDFMAHAEGSALISFGQTKVICTASVEETVPPFLRDTGKGWVTAEYAMLPRATHTRSRRERSKVGGRTSEIQRLIGRSLRAVTDLKALGERSVLIDCDVMQADGGTRTAAITGAYVALHQALQKLVDKGDLSALPLLDSVAAVSVGIVQGELCLDLEYTEDSQADVDMNFVMTGKGQIIEVQGTAEKHPFSKAQLDQMYDLAAQGIGELSQLQKRALKL